jgi:hypothetical protein
MDIHQFGDWLSATAPSQAIQASTWAIPAIQTVHILAIALVFTLGIMLSLRFAGFGFSADPLPQLAARSGKRIWLLLLVLLVTGALLVTAEPGRTITNPVFYWKMGLLAAVIVVTMGLIRSARHTEKANALQVAASVLAVLLWVGIIFAGRLIAYIESY